MNRENPVAVYADALQRIAHNPWFASSEPRTPAPLRWA